MQIAAFEPEISFGAVQCLPPSLLDDWSMAERTKLPLWNSYLVHVRYTRP